MSKAFQTAKPTDPTSRLPSSRRLLWEHAEDTRVANTWLTLISVILCMACLILSGVLFSIYKRPPAILQEDAGFVMWRTSDVYRLREDIVRTYIQATVGSLLTIHPGAYDTSKLDGLVDVAILKKYGEEAQATGGNRLEKNTRRLFAIYDVRRWVSPEYPSYIAIAVRGEKVTYEEYRDDLGNVRVTPENKLALYVAYLRQQTPTPQNPWGIYMAGIQEIPPKDAEHVWSQTFKIAGSKDAKGIPILPPKL